MWDDFAQYLLEECENRNVRIAEIAVGKFTKISDILSEKDNITLIRTDITPCDSTVIKDDVTCPDLNLYRDVDIIYSIRPPSELQPHIAKLAKRIGAKLIIKPLTNEDLNTQVPMKLKNYNRASFYVMGD